MLPKVLSASHIRDYTIRIRFADGSEGDVDLSAELDGPIFVPLRDPDYFRQFRVDPQLHTLVWPNGADFAPEFLHSRIRVSA